MQPMTMLEVKHHLKDLERQVKREGARASSPWPGVHFGVLRTAFRAALRALRGAGAARTLRAAKGR